MPQFLRMRPALRHDDRGAAIVEAAIALPLLIALLFAFIAFADWFFVAHGLQQAANDGARAAVGGLDGDERGALAEAAVRASLVRTGGIDPALATATIDDDGATVTVRLAYDASARPILALGPAPMSQLAIRRAASVRIDGL